MFSERYQTRRMPLIIGLVVLLGAQVMLMEAPNYWVMCFSRVLQGISSSMVWAVGLALLQVYHLSLTLPSAHTLYKKM
jgi:DHA1 family solute carrier family 18 vesicular amine transporter 1/2